MTLEAQRVNVLIQVCLQMVYKTHNLFLFRTTDLESSSVCPFCFGWKSLKLSFVRMSRITLKFMRNQFHRHIFLVEKKCICFSQRYLHCRRRLLYHCKSHHLSLLVFMQVSFYHYKMGVEVTPQND